MTGTQPTSGTETFPVFIKETLYNQTMDAFIDVEMPHMDPKPQVISWNHRFFLLNEDEKYVEIVVWFIN